LIFDIIIIGASSSGLYAAELLARAGKHVGVFERQVEINPARRTYIITPEIRKFMSNIPARADLCRTRVMSVESRSRSVDIDFRDPDLIIERNLLSKGLYERALEAGAEIYLGYRFLRFENEAGDVKLIFNSNDTEIEATANLVIGADGLKSHTAKAAGISLPPSVSIVQAEVDLPSGWDPSMTKVWFDVDETHYFYWLIPESTQRGVLGLVGENARRSRVLLDRFIGKHNLTALRYQASQVAMHHPRLRPWGKVGSIPLYMIGDAAGQVKVTTVGGTVTGFWGARAVVQSILHGTRYAKELRPLKRELDLHWYIRYLLERLDNVGYDRLVKCITPSVQQFLAERNRDRMTGGFWQLPFREPRLLLIGIQIMLKLSFSRTRRSIQHQLEVETGD